MRPVETKLVLAVADMQLPSRRLRLTGDDDGDNGGSDTNDYYTDQLDLPAPGPSTDFATGYEPPDDSGR